MESNSGSSYDQNINKGYTDYNNWGKGKGSNDWNKGKGSNDWNQNYNDWNQYTNNYNWNKGKGKYDDWNQYTGKSNNWDQSYIMEKGKGKSKGKGKGKGKESNETIIESVIDPNDFIICTTILNNQELHTELIECPYLWANLIKELRIFYKKFENLDDSINQLIKSIEGKHIKCTNNYCHDPENVLRVIKNIVSNETSCIFENIKFKTNPDKVRKLPCKYSNKCIVWNLGGKYACNFNHESDPIVSQTLKDIIELNLQQVTPCTKGIKCDHAPRNTCHYHHDIDELKKMKKIYQETYSEFGINFDFGKELYNWKDETWTAAWYATQKKLIK